VQYVAELTTEEQSRPIVNDSSHTFSGYIKHFYAGLIKRPSKMKSDWIILDA